VWERHGPWYVQGRDELQALDLPHREFLVARIDRAYEPGWLDYVDIQAVREAVDRMGEPVFAATWGDLLKAAGRVPD
jgi:hypothetical protein